MAGVMVGGPTPWWQLPEYKGSRSNLEASAPSGYQYDPVKMQYVMTPTQQGQNVADFSKAALGGLAGSLNLSGSGGTGLGTGGGGGVGSGTPSNIPGIAPVDTSAAQSAAFARAKDTAGQLARSELDSLRGIMGETGQLGGGAESRSSRQIVEDAAGQLGQVSREQAIQAAQQAQQNAIVNYQGGITQRGQDIQAQEAAANLAAQQNQQAFQRQIELMNLALSGLGKVSF